MAKTIPERHRKCVTFLQAMPGMSRHPHRNRRKARCVPVDPRPSECGKQPRAFGAVKTDRSASLGAAAETSSPLRRSENLFAKATAQCTPIRKFALHEIAPPFSSSGGARIHRLFRVKFLGCCVPIGFSSTLLCTDHFIREKFLTRRDELPRPARNHTRQRTVSTAKGLMTKPTLVLIMSAMALMTAGCSTSRAGAPTTQSAAAQRDYDRLSGTWQLTRGVVNGKPVPARVARNTV